MPRRIIERIREKIRQGKYDLTAHAAEEIMYGYRCEYCEGTVQPRTVEREAFKHKGEFIVLEDVTIGVCDVCGNRYNSSDILHAVHDIATGARVPEKTEEVPVAHV